jgi:hypothetical protein
MQLSLFSVNGFHRLAALTFLGASLLSPLHAGVFGQGEGAPNVIEEVDLNQEFTSGPLEDWGTEADRPEWKYGDRIERWGTGDPWLKIFEDPQCTEGEAEESVRTSILEEYPLGRHTISRSARPRGSGVQTSAPDREIVESTICTRLIGSDSEGQLVVYRFNSQFDMGMGPGEGGTWWREEGIARVTTVADSNAKIVEKIHVSHTNFSEK